MRKTTRDIRRESVPEETGWLGVECKVPTDASSTFNGYQGHQVMLSALVTMPDVLCIYICCESVQ
jgi:hypothetical protein